VGKGASNWDCLVIPDATPEECGCDARAVHGPHGPSDAIVASHATKESRRLAAANPGRPMVGERAGDSGLRGARWPEDGRSRQSACSCGLAGASPSASAEGGEPARTRMPMWVSGVSTARERGLRVASATTVRWPRDGRRRGPWQPAAVARAAPAALVEGGEMALDTLVCQAGCDTGGVWASHVRGAWPSRAERRHRGQPCDEGCRGACCWQHGRSMKGERAGGFDLRGGRQPENARESAEFVQQRTRVIPSAPVEGRARECGCRTGVG
jgi:hypothetical protein